MIIVDFYQTRSDGIKLYRTYSDQDLMIRQKNTNVLYNEAIDVEGSLYTYEETEIPINFEQSADESSIIEDEFITDCENTFEIVPEYDKISAEEFMALVEEIL
jgi:hypothetical protein